MEFMNDPDFVRSPLTGLGRDHWMAIVRSLVDGVFSHVESPEGPVLLPKPSPVCYPNEGDPASRFRAAEFEGISRTLMAALPLIAADRNAMSHGIGLFEFYRSQILLMSTPDSPRFLGTFEQFDAGVGRQLHQHTCEGAVLSLCLMLLPDLWNSYSQSEKKQIAKMISNYAHGRTNAQNWRMFNVLMLTFLKKNGFGIDDAVLQDHLLNLMSYYSGDGWYVDHASYDMYNPWAFHFWLPYWCTLYGDEHEPEIAAIIESRNRQFVETWPRFYDRRGHQLMWGRSLIYRFAAAAALTVRFVRPEPGMNPGFARRIASGNLQQFFLQKGFLKNNVPCLGFTRPFESLIQPYSCAASPFWFSQLFTALLLPESNPFWAATENEGFWPELGGRSVEINLSGPGIQIINHGKTGATEIRTAKVSHREPYYNQLSFNTFFGWEATDGEGPHSGHYSFREQGRDEPFRLPGTISYSRSEGGVLYRQLDLKSDLPRPYYGGEWMDLADITVPGGVIRVDRLRVAYANDLVLGHYALPHVDGGAVAVVQGDADGCRVISAETDGRAICMTAVHGWSRLHPMQRSRVNSEADESTYIMAERSRETDSPGMEIFITVLLHRSDNTPWSADEQMPINEWHIVPLTEGGFPCGVKLELKDGRTFIVNYKNIDGCH